MASPVTATQRAASRLSHALGELVLQTHLHTTEEVYRWLEIHHSVDMAVRSPEPDPDALTPRDEKLREAALKPSPITNMFTEAEEGVDTEAPTTEDKLREAYIEPLRAMGTEQDNWAHRSDTMRCRTCMFYVVKHPFDGSESFSFGRCRNGAPTLKGWPAIYSTDWCGAHKLDAEKI